MGTICLALGTFINPIGFDILVYKLTELTKNYWSTMYVLYFFALLLSGFSYISFKLNKRVLGNWLLMIGLFLNPFGYDVLVYSINSITNDYWMTMSFLYMMTIIFFGLFMLFYQINPLKSFSPQIKNAHTKVKNKLRKI